MLREFPCKAAAQGKEKTEKEGERGGKLSLSSKCEKMAKRASYFKTIADLNHCIGFGQYLWGGGGGGFWLCHNKIHLFSPPSLRVFSISMIPLIGNQFSLVTPLIALNSEKQAIAKSLPLLTIHFLAINEWSFRYIPTF